MKRYIDKVTSDNHEYLQSLLAENQRLTELVGELETQSRTYSERYVQVEQQNTHLANLYVATYQLHGTLDRVAVLEAIKEIIINLIGSEELAIWELDPTTNVLELVDSFGLDATKWKRVRAGEGIVGSSVHTGERYVRGEANVTPIAAERGLNAVIPLKLEDRVIAVIGIFSLLQQKQGFENVDFELFDLLSSHAASALFCTSAFAQVLTASV